MVDDRSAKQNFDLSIINNDVDQSSINLCTISTDGTMTMLPYKLREPVFCDCDTMHRKHCTKNYNSLTLCGQIWNGHTYPSMSTIVQLLAFISNCEYSGVSIDNVMNSMKFRLKSFISIFNSTMRRWFKGEQFLEREIIQYSTLQNLTTNLKFLSDIAVQESEQCLEITTRLLKVDFMENDLLQVEINVRNVRKDTDMNYLSLLVKVVDAETLNVVDQFIRTFRNIAQT
uniref:Uncharacterized protein n=1 Tax=Romanomermis culicivorax TaxID=13658 RepID=A0A915L1B7_ROMCU